MRIRDLSFSLSSNEMDGVRQLRWPSREDVVKIVHSLSAMHGSPVDSFLVAKAPYRVCPLGAHVDHQGGVVTAMALDAGIVLVFAPSENPTVTVGSDSFDGDVAFNLEDPMPRKGSGNEQNNWGDYMRGAVLALQRKGHRIQKGLTGRITAPPGVHESGISSSAAVGVACLMALGHTNGLSLAPEEYIELDRLIENEYMGLKNGILDQSAILRSRRGHLTVIDCDQGTHHWVPLPLAAEHDAAGSSPSNKPSILLVFSGTKAALAASSGFNGRVEESQRAAQLLGSSLGIQCPDGQRPLRLRDIPKDGYSRSASCLDDCSARRAAHFFGEQQRVCDGVRFWEEGDLPEFGRLMRESGRSSVECYEVGTEPMRTLQQLLWMQPGVHGARFSGAGTRGACVALVDPGSAAEAASSVLKAYTEAYPELSQASCAFLCDTGDAAEVIPAPTHC